jgi:cysteine-rich repeat protein
MLVAVMRAALLCAVGLLPAACLEPAVETCADGTVCPATSVCVPGGCAPRSSIAACEGLDAGAVCELAGGQGRCRDEVCVVASCGDGVTDPDEACDDGNNLDGDGCARDCDSTEVCGDGVRDVGEQCDLGADNADTPDSACRTTCQVPACGDEIVDPDRGESCDDGDANADVPDAGCRTSCQVPRCGDGIVDGGLGEACDDGNTVGADGCAFDCGSDERCGNGTVDYAVGERCDDGNRRERDGCASSCQVETVLWQPLAGTPQLRARHEPRL